ncbi:uncharacterized protein LOC130201013 [Pseudoliparis swirei]|uniref:uncharacterized protein LOC130201013 n=1 Tax=Pseudoliparis swirei TaxID=2059687 RepID=UPI0024BE7576|nr:uncharacterized protein LOC130201013 [Pseudoliparis swirei]
MWKEMDHSHRKARLETPGLKEGEMGSCRSLVQGMGTQLDRQHGCVWTSEDGPDRRYPPPNLQALLQLDSLPVWISAHVLCPGHGGLPAVPRRPPPIFLPRFHYFFPLFPTNPGLLDARSRTHQGLHGVIAEPQGCCSLSLLAASLHHHCLLTRKQPQFALRYLRRTRLSSESLEDATLCTDALLQNSCVSEAWALLKRSHAKNDHMVVSFLQACDGCGLCAEALPCLPVGYNGSECLAIQHKHKHQRC